MTTPKQGKPTIAWGRPVGAGGLDRCPGHITDARRLLQRLGDRDFDRLGAEELALVAGQDVEPGRGPLTAPTSLGAPRSGVATDRVISVHDPDTRHVHKTVRQPTDDYKAHVAGEVDTGLITDLCTTSGPAAPKPRGHLGLEWLAGEDARLTSVGRFGLRCR
jgi:hypothetical protein